MSTPDERSSELPPVYTSACIRDEPASWPLVDSVERFRGGIVAAYTDWVQVPGPQGTETVARDRITHPGSVAVVALDEQFQVLLLRQYRHAVARRLWEIPAGLRDNHGEDLVDAARRELLEETGYQAEQWYTLLDSMPSPGFCDEQVRIFLARGLWDVPAAKVTFQRVHEEAEIVLSWVPLDEAVSAAFAGHLHNSLVLCGVLAAHAAAQDGFSSLRPLDAPE